MFRDHTHAAELYKDRKGEFRWTVFARNGRRVADGAEGYTRRSDARKAFRKLFGRRIRLTEK